MKNDILRLKGSFEQTSAKGRPAAPKLPVNGRVAVEDIQRLVMSLEEMENFWKAESILNGGCLVSVYYNRIIAKSNRTDSFLKPPGAKHANATIVGAKFSKEKSKHIITHFIPLSVITESIRIANASIEILKKEFMGVANDSVFNSQDTFKSINFNEYDISKSTFQRVIVDTCYIEKFDLERGDFDFKKNSLVTFYDTGIDLVSLLKKLNISVFNEKVLDKTTVLLDHHHLQTILEKAPYLVVMAVEDISELTLPKDYINKHDTGKISIPSPKNEPIIGVIDTLFDESSYFNEWVEFHNKVDPNIGFVPEDYNHGTAVSSIIVDGPSFNPDLDDGCGRFRVRHFGVALKRGFSSITIIRTIKEIVASNPDIRVWNFSLGSNVQIEENFISAEAAVLDQIQSENDVIFVIAGTNKIGNEAAKERIGSPADSINSIIVNSVDFNDKPAPYSREGGVLSFFTKPDVCYYGGANGKGIVVCKPLGKDYGEGTSYAAPWISRKLCYLINVIGLSREVAKALVVDSAIGWGKYDEMPLKGHGVVPIRIDDIIKSPADEIKFIVEGVSEKYDTYNYSFPVPVSNGKHPCVTKATLCYFPKCSKNQGVDYTNTELSIQFGRIKNGKLKPINNDKQGLDDDCYYLYEEKARSEFRKWDNVKHIREKTPKYPRGKTVYENPMWGMSIKTKERLNKNDGENIRFGVVVTLKDINGVNRIDDFIQQCSLKGWIVNRINVENRIDIYHTAEEEISID